MGLNGVTRRPLIGHCRAESSRRRRKSSPTGVAAGVTNFWRVSTCHARHRSWVLSTHWVGRSLIRRLHHRGVINSQSPSDTALRGHHLTLQSMEHTKCHSGDDDQAPPAHQRREPSSPPLKPSYICGGAFSPRSIAAHTRSASTRCGAGP